MKTKDLRDELSHRLALNINDDWGLKESWKKLTKLLSESVDDTIIFFKDTCTDEKLFWLSEVFADVSENLQSEDFVQTLKERLRRVTPNEYSQQKFKHKLLQDISFEEYVESIMHELFMPKAHWTTKRSYCLSPHCPIFGIRDCIVSNDNFYSF